MKSLINEHSQLILSRKKNNIHNFLGISQFCFDLADVILKTDRPHEISVTSGVKAYFRANLITSLETFANYSTVKVNYL